MLTFNLKKEWFEKIKSGEKTHEYRERQPYWYRRLFGYWYHSKNNLPIKDNMICFACGYPKKEDKEKRLYAKIVSVKIISGKNTGLKINKDVFDIEFELISECEGNDGL